MPQTHARCTLHRCGSLAAVPHCLCACSTSRPLHVFSQKPVTSLADYESKPALTLKAAPPARSSIRMTSNNAGINMTVLLGLRADLTKAWHEAALLVGLELLGVVGHREVGGSR